MDSNKVEYHSGTTGQFESIERELKIAIEGGDLRKEIRIKENLQELQDLMHSRLSVNMELTNDSDHFDRKALSPCLRLEEVQEIMGELFFGPEHIRDTYGVEISPDRVPLKITKLQALNAKRLGHMIDLHIDRFSNGNYFTLFNLGEYRKSDARFMKSLYDFAKENFIHTADKLEWRETSTRPIPASMTEQRSYLEQTEDLVAYVLGEVSKGEVLPPIWNTAIQEFEEKKEKIRQILTGNNRGNFTSDRQKADNEHAIVQSLLELKITKLIRPTLVSLIKSFSALGVVDKASCTSEKTLQGKFIFAYKGGRGEIDINTENSERTFSNTFAVFSRSL